MKKSFKWIQYQKKFFIYPDPPVPQKKYFIECLNEQDALRIIQMLSRNLLKTPLEDETLYTNPTLHGDGKTPIYTFIE